MSAPSPFASLRPLSKSKDFNSTLYIIHTFIDKTHLLSSYENKERILLLLLLTTTTVSLQEYGLLLYV
ncbi:hypothetical protein OAV88_02160 [bacterium]|nr:hypothetical protein [bacterium]